MSFALEAHAKINLTLEVLGEREDGYHEVKSLMQTISLADTLIFEASSGLNFESNIPSLNSADNLVIRAAVLLREAAGCHVGASIRLTKRIPVCAGLGSGSTDAAATLKALNRLWELDFPLDRLTDLAAKLGSDVSFFLHGGTALAEGRGERITPLDTGFTFQAVLLVPAGESIPGKTSRLYARLNSSHFTSGEFTDRIVREADRKEPLDADALYNVFDHVAFDFFPGLDRYRTVFKQAGAKSIYVAGAGPTLFTVSPDRSSAEALFQRLHAAGHEAYLVNSTGLSMPEQDAIRW
ncbi:MAG: 4-(cytidine 5'-diphospho)-2-C-methyl-D-erythritol kinase [Dehalococcoidia bacterium]|nr:4-(cytidine 5'-diphospho)-2-C-methyl-D-erythritol kinase [Dehalococcoidia bacterium]